MGPNEVDVKDLQSLPNASKKDGAAPAIQSYGNVPKKKQVTTLGFIISLDYTLELSFPLLTPAFAVPSCGSVLESGVQRMKQ